MSDFATCPVCDVRICAGEVRFAHGGAGNKARLWARVCSITQKTGCINDFEATESVTAQDRFGVVETNEEKSLELLRKMFPGLE